MGKARRRHTAARAARIEPTHAPPPRTVARKAPVAAVAPLLIVVAGFFAYHNSFRGAFVLDDGNGIIDNASIRSFSTAFDPPVKSPVMGRPLVNLSLAVNYAIGGLDVTSYHVFNVTAHVLTALILFGIVRRTLESAPRLAGRFSAEARGIAAAVALLWVVHPLTTETVDYTIQRTELLVGFFSLLTVYCAIRGLQSPTPLWWHVASIAGFAPGLSSKEIIVVVPVLVFAYDWLFWSSSFRETISRRRWLWLGYAATFALFLLFAGTRLRGALKGMADRISPFEYALTQTGALVHYLVLSFRPYPLVADYVGWPIAKSITHVLPAFLIIVGLAGLTLWGVVRRRPLAFLGLWFFAILAPTSSIRPITNEVVAERRMYLPLAAVLVIVVLGGRELLRWLGAPRPAGAAIVTAAAVVLAFVTVARNRDYRSVDSFWSDVLEKRPDNARAHMWVGNGLRRKGRREEALIHLSEAARLAPKNTNAQNSLGALLVSMGRADEGVVHFRAAIAVDPANSLAHNNLGSVLAQRGQTDEALEHFQEAVRSDPAYASAHNNLATELARRGRTDEAIRHFETAVRLRPDWTSARRTLEELRQRQTMSVPP